MRCWSCGTGRQGQEDPYFPDTTDALRRRVLPQLTPARYLIGLSVWFVFCCIVVTAIMWLTQVLPVTFVNLMAGITVVFISGIMIGVTVNVMGELGTLIQRHFTDEDFSEMPVIQVRTRNRAGHDNSARHDNIAKPTSTTEFESGTAHDD